MKFLVSGSAVMVLMLSAGCGDGGSESGASNQNLLSHFQRQDLRVGTGYSAVESVPVPDSGSTLFMLTLGFAGIAALRKRS